MAQDMGVPEYYLCGYCGDKCALEEIVEHIKSKKCFIGLVKND
jgi:hypothetical protein